MGSARRSDAARQMATHLETIVARLAPACGALTVAGWVPALGEPDLRDWMRSLPVAGIRVAMPKLARGETRLRFHPDHADAHHVTDHDGVVTLGLRADECVPDLVLAPVLGWDGAGYRLGRGRGHYDRTLSRMPASTLLVGVGYAAARLETIHPQPFDIAMDAIVTEDGVYLSPVSRLPAGCAACCRKESRALP